ncbi:Indoleamine 2,3-dioxygenase, partial [Trametes polyzona]
DLTAYRVRADSTSGAQPFNGRLFDVHPDTGFFPAQPYPKLAGEYALWEDALVTARQVLKLGEDKGEEARAKLASGERWRQQLRSWPVLDASRLGDRLPVLRRAHTVLAFLMHFYIHSSPPQHAEEQIVVPRSISIPLLHVSGKLDLPPILTFADIVLWNWEFINPALPLTVDNIRYVNLFSGTETEHNFYLLSAAAELKGVEMLQIFERFMNMSCLNERSAIAAVARDLEHLVTIINELSAILQGSKNTVDPHTFYWAARPWWNGPDPAAPWVFEGPNAAYHLGGASAGQSAVLHALDVFLDVDHALKQARQPEPSAENRRANTGFMEKMRRYMPAEHRMYLTQLAKRPVREMALRVPALRKPYNAAVEALKKLRDGHIRVATLYIVSQARSMPPASMGGAAAFQQSGERSVGTGGNPVSALLKAGRDATSRTMLREE